jgi:predicted DNA-binding transcriptional regulator YafY
MRAARLISLLMLLQARGRLTAAELAAELEVTPRTIYRDIDALSAAGVPVFTERGPHGGCSLLESYRTTLTGLNTDEVRALFAMLLPGVAADLGGDQARRSARRKLLAALPAGVRPTADALSQRIHLDPDDWLQPAEAIPFLPLLQDALWQERRVRMTYRRGDGTWVQRLIDPYGLVAKGATWYCVAAAQRRVLSFRVSRIRDATLTEGRFQRPASFDLAAYWREWAGTLEKQLRRYEVTLGVPPAGVNHLVHLFGEGIATLAEAAPLRDNQLLLTLQFASADDATRRLLPLPETITVLAPAGLRRSLHRAALAVARRYAPTPETHP